MKAHKLRTKLRAIRRFAYLPESPVHLRRIVYYGSGLYHRLGADHVLLFGGGIAFSIFICVMPLVLIIFAVLGQIFESTLVVQQLERAVHAFIPYQDSADRVIALLAAQIQQVVANKSIAGLVGAIGLLFAASGLFSALRTALTAIFRIDSKKSFARQKLRDFAMVLLVLVLFLVLILLLPVSSVLKEFATNIRQLQFLQLPVIRGVIGALLGFAVIFGIFSIIYALVPHGRLGARTILWSAAWAGALWETARQVFGFYIRHSVTLSGIYGAYIFIIIAAFWVYYSAVVLLLGAEIGQLYREKSETD